ncbi:MAG TPA: DUF2147 domain-containing protein [Pseudolabrys sp.]
MTVIAAGFAAALAYGGPLRAAPAAIEPSVVGLWEQLDDHGHSWFLFFERDGVYEGAVVKMYLKPTEPPNPICSGCTGDQKNAPVLGLVIVKNMQRHGLQYDNGKIIDPRNGNVYDAKMKISPDGQRLTLRGYLGIDLFGQDQVWKRLPDQALKPNDFPPNLLPYLAAAPAAAPADNKFTSGGAPHPMAPKNQQPVR